MHWLCSRTWQHLEVRCSDLILLPLIFRKLFLKKYLRPKKTYKIQLLCTFHYRFPYLCYESGGGAFLVPYFIMLVLCGIPLLLMELSMGQYTRRGPIGALGKMAPILQGEMYSDRRGRSKAFCSYWFYNVTCRLVHFFTILMSFFERYKRQVFAPFWFLWNRNRLVSCIV